MAKIAYSGERRDSPGDYELVSDGDEYNLIIHNATIEDEEEYICTDLDNLDREAVASLYVIVGPSVAISNVTGTAGIEGDYFAALCEITQNGNPPGIDEVYWINPENNTIFNGSALLEIDALDRADAGQYQCVMSNTLHDGSSGIGKASFFLDVQYAYELSITNTTGAVVMEGDFYAAKCDIEQTGNPAEIFEQHWVDPTGAEVNYGEYTLQIGAIDRSDGGQYACVVSNTYYNDLQGIGEATTHIDVQYSPDVIINDISDARVIENDRYEANCTVDANPTATTAWKYTADNVTVVDVYLTIESAQRHHAGAYTCESNNTLYTGDTGYGYDTIELDVQYRPVVDDGHAYCIGGDSVDLVCVVYEANPYPNSFTWTKDGDHVSSGQTYNIPKCDLSHAGIYTCTAANVFHDGTEGRDEGMTELVVHLRPTILTDDIQTLEVEAGDNVTLVCRADAYPVATILWRDNKDQPITGDEPNREIITPEPEGTISTSTLHITDIQDSDFGEYNCTATNEIGEDSHTGEILRKELSESFLWWLLLVILVIVVILLIVCVAILYLFIRNRKKSSKESAEVTDSKPIADTTNDVTSYGKVEL
ncbi:cell adhesion molecule Dscam1-like [Ptychodera flava]|uniref:cell adhesion molecule Dscam1-like n=1 Tax=Ptychodera flava TaxID=63121 RepID=UPI003969EAF5